MTPVLVIEADEDLRDALQLLLEEAGYAASGTDSPASALDLLLTCPDRMVVLFDAGIPRVSDGHVTALAYADDPRMRRHAYVCMTTSAALMHPELRVALARLSVPIIEEPFDNDVLLRLVARAAASLAPP